MKTDHNMGGAGDGREWAKIYLEHQRAVYRAAYGRTHSEHDAEDVLQTIFVKLLQREIQPQLGENAKGYLCRAAINESVSLFRARERVTLTDESDGLAVPSPTDESGEDGDRCQRLQEAISKLKPKAAHIVRLRFEEEYSVEEIAERLQEPRTTVAMTLSRALVKLKQWLCTQEKDSESKNEKEKRRVRSRRVRENSADKSAVRSGR